MKEISIDESREIQIKILEEVDKFCEMNNLTYYMSYGTLLGAVRHKGFIPWDDDVDIAMPYPDFIRFCSEYSGTVYKVNHWTIQPDFYCNYAKIEDTRTLLLEETVLQYKIGINIDIAPIIGLPNELEEAQKYFRRIAFVRKLLTLKKMKYRSGRDPLKQLMMFISRIPLGLISNRTLNMVIDSLCKRYRYSESKYVICVGSFNPVKEIIEKKRLGSPTRLEFEGHSFWAPSGYDEWLTCMFNDYMKLPPKEKRISHHTFRTYWRD